VAKEMYINLNLEKLFTNSSIIDTAKRKVPMSLEHKFMVDQYTILAIPEGYKVNYVPPGFEYNDENLSFSIAYKQTPASVIARQSYRRKTLLVQPPHFNAWNTAVRKILAQYREQVVLQKQ
jgi:hypothetical protein